MDSGDPRRLPSWTGHGEMVRGGATGLGWIDRCAVALGAVVANGIAYVAISAAFPASQLGCIVFTGCHTLPKHRLLTVHQWDRYAVFVVWIALSIGIVVWRWRRLVKAVVLVQAIALTLVTLNTINYVNANGS